MKLRVKKRFGQWHVQQNYFGLVWMTIRIYDSWDEAYNFAYRYVSIKDPRYLPLSKIPEIPWQLPRVDSF